MLVWKPWASRRGDGAIRRILIGRGDPAMLHRMNHAIAESKMEHLDFKTITQRGLPHFHHR
jgi:hypothetical protein